MYQEKEKDVKNVVGDVNTDSLELGVYTVYDCVLKQYDLPLCVPVSKLDDYMKLLVNDVTSKYYNHESDYILNKIGVFCQGTGDILLHFVERISVLDKYVDRQKRNLQTVVQTLNFLPTGYFKMPSEMKQSIQEKIDISIAKYVEDYVVPDMDIQSSKIKSLEDKLSAVTSEKDNFEKWYITYRDKYGLLDS